MFLHICKKCCNFAPVISPCLSVDGKKVMYPKNCNTTSIANLIEKTQKLNIKNTKMHL